MAIGGQELIVWVLAGIAVLLFGSGAVLKWAKTLRLAKHEFSKPVTDEEDKAAAKVV